jgi:hypothetical protein
MESRKPVSLDKNVEEIIAKNVTSMPEHLVDGNKCPGTGMSLINIPRLVEFDPSMRTATINVDCPKCNITIQTSVQY